MDEITPGPYAKAARAYWEAGWTNVLPVHDGQGLPGKSHVPRGYTGINGGNVSWPDLNAWIEGPEGRHNVGVRLTCMVGIDVDAHDGELGEATLAAAVAQLGPLPDTWSSTSRGPGASRILFFRVPLAREALLRRQEKVFVEAFGENIEILHRGHRFAVCWPSVHPDTGREYRWYAPDGGESERVPERGEIPELPTTWLDFLAPERTGSDQTTSDGPDRTASDGVGSLLFGTAPAAPDYRTEDEAARILRDAIQAFIAPDADGRATRLLPALALVAGHGIPGGFWTAQQASDNIEQLAIGCGYVAKHGLADLRLQVERGLRDGAASPWVKVAPAARDAFEVATGDGQALLTPLERLRAKMLSRDDLELLPEIRPLIAGVLDMDSASWMIGAPGGFKSFVALDVACHVATDLAWREHYTTHGRVLYIAAEGSKGIRKRVLAWESKYGRRVENMDVLALPVQAYSGNKANPIHEDWRALVEIARVDQPVLVVVDTQARVTVGLEENSNSDMSLFTECVRLLKEASGACALVVHHTGRDGKDARGASAIDGAQDTELKVERPGGSRRSELTASILLDKEKDGPDGSRIEIKLTEVAVGVSAYTGKPITSLAVLPLNEWEAGQVEHGALPQWQRDLDGMKQEIMRVMEDHSGAAGATFPDIDRWINRTREETGTKEKVNTKTRSSAVICLLGECSHDAHWPEGRAWLVRNGVSRVILPRFVGGSDDNY